jgi:hypothetical protein
VHLGCGRLHPGFTDRGTYLVSLVVQVFGSSPDQIVARSTRSTAESRAKRDDHGLGRRQAVLHTTILVNTPTSATIAGTEATLPIGMPEIVGP